MKSYFLISVTLTRTCKHTNYGRVTWQTPSVIVPLDKLPALNTDDFLCVRAHCSWFYYRRHRGIIALPCFSMNLQLKNAKRFLVSSLPRDTRLVTGLQSKHVLILQSGNLRPKVPPRRTSPVSCFRDVFASGRGLFQPCHVVMGISNRL